MYYNIIHAPLSILQDHCSLSLAGVGSVRYLSPELLEGAVNLSDPAAALRQADVYAMGLTLWEVARRCKDLYQV